MNLLLFYQYFTNQDKRIHVYEMCTKNMVITPGVINDPAEIDYFVQLII